MPLLFELQNEDLKKKYLYNTLFQKILKERLPESENYQIYQQITHGRHISVDEFPVIKYKDMFITILGMFNEKEALENHFDYFLKHQYKDVKVNFLYYLEKQNKPIENISTDKEVESVNKIVSTILEKIANY